MAQYYMQEQDNIKDIHVATLDFNTNIQGRFLSKFEPPYDKINDMACATSEDSDQPGHPPSLIRVFTMRSMGS